MDLKKSRAFLKIELSTIGGLILGQDKHMAAITSIV